MTPLFLSTLLLFFSVAGLLLAAVGESRSRAIGNRLMQVTAGTLSVVPSGASSRVQLQRKVFDLVRWTRTRLGMQDSAKLLDRLSHAGFRSPAARDVYFAARLLGPLISVVLCSFLPSNHFLGMTVLGGVSYLLPDMILSRLLKRRREKIRRSIPDAIDLLVICVDAGLGLDQAMLRVGQELVTSHPEIYEEFMQINREQRAGKLRLDAWQSMAERSQLTEIDGFVNMLMQTERFGTPIARALSNFGDGIRLKRRQRAEELAAKTTVKIIFPLVLFIFPSMFIVLLGPAAMTIMKGFGAMAK